MKAGLKQSIGESMCLGSEQNPGYLNAIAKIWAGEILEISARFTLTTFRTIFSGMLVIKIEVGGSFSGQCFCKKLGTSPAMSQFPKSGWHDDQRRTNETGKYIGKNTVFWMVLREGVQVQAYRAAVWLEFAFRSGVLIDALRLLACMREMIDSWRAGTSSCLHWASTFRPF